MCKIYYVPKCTMCTNALCYWILSRVVSIIIRYTFFEASYKICPSAPCVQLHHFIRYIYDNYLLLLDKNSSRPTIIYDDGQILSTKRVELELNLVTFDQDIQIMVIALLLLHESARRGSLGISLGVLPSVLPLNQN